MPIKKLKYNKAQQQKASGLNPYNIQPALNLHQIVIKKYFYARGERGRPVTERQRYNRKYF